MASKDMAHVREKRTCTEDRTDPSLRTKSAPALNSTSRSAVFST
jgi:hypothetical protein